MRTKFDFKKTVGGCLLGLALTAGAHAIGLDNTDGSVMTEGVIDFSEVQETIEKSEKLSVPQQIRQQIREIEGALTKLFQGDYEEAKVLFEKSAKNGNAAAHNSLGILHEKGMGTKQDPVEAVKWYRSAMALGSLDAIYNLAVLLVDAPGEVEQNIDEAMALFQMACDAGDKGACEYADELQQGES